MFNQLSQIASAAAHHSTEIAKIFAAGVTEYVTSEQFVQDLIKMPEFNIGREAYRAFKK